MSDNKLFAPANIPKDVEHMLTSDIERALFLARILQLELVANAKAHNITIPLKNSYQDLVVGTRAFDQKVRSMLPKSLNDSVSKDLSNSSVYEIGNIIEAARHLMDPKYKSFIEELVTLLETLKGVTVNSKKFTALLKFFTNEIKAESAGTTSIIYDESTDEITFRMVLASNKPEDNGIKQ